MAERTELQPKSKLTNQDGTVWSVYDEKDTGLMLVSLENLTNGLVTTTTIANPEKRTSAHRAWAGARHSRAAGYPWEIMHEMGEKGVDPDQKIDEMFSTYGHASVGDMARLEAQFMGVPMHFCLSLFNITSINSGQEKSTRYQPKFGQAILHDFGNYFNSTKEAELGRLAREYQGFGDLSLELYSKQRELLTLLYRDYYKPDSDNKGHQSALTSRVLDSVRYFLLLGQHTGMSLETSARDWSRIIGELKGSMIPFYGQVGDQLKHLFAPSAEEEKILAFKAEAPSLIRHSEPAVIVNENLATLRLYIEEKTDMLADVSVNTKFKGRVDQKVTLTDKEYSEGDKLTAQYLLTIWPGLNTKVLMEWLHYQPDKITDGISNIIFKDHNNYHELPNFARVTSMTVNIQTFLGELRDFNRHRSFGRFMPFPLVHGEAWDYDTAMQIISRGFGLPLYLTEVPEFAKAGKSFEKDLASYYNKFQGFIEKIKTKYGEDIDYSFATNLLPLAHQMDLWMHGDPKQLAYLTAQRTRPGGHINYRDLAYKANQLVADSDPYLEGMRLKAKPDPSSRKEFFDRS